MNTPHNQRRAPAPDMRERPRISPQRRAEIERMRRRRRRIGIALVCALVFCTVMLIHAIRTYEMPAPPLAAEVISLGERQQQTTPPDTEAPTVEDPIVPVVSRPAATATTKTLTDEIDSEYAVLITADTSAILARKGADKRIYPASLTKIMSLIVAYESITDLSETFTVTSTIIDPLYLAEATLAGFAPGETVTMRDLLYGMILPSGAEASVSLAIHTAGSEEEFVSRMNAKAKEMGLKNTHFTNCSGLHHEDHYTTCTEMAMILAYALQYPACREILSTYQYTTSSTEKHPEGVELTSTMFSRVHGDEPTGAVIVAGKTGYTHQARHCLASYGEREADGAGFIFVTTNADGKFEPIFDAIHAYSEYIHK